MQDLLDQNFASTWIIFFLMPWSSIPDERVWALAKSELANGCPHDVDELIEDIIRSINGNCRSPAKLHGCVEQPDLPSFLR